MPRFTRQSRPVWRTPHPSAMCSRTDSTFSGREPGVEQGRPLALGEAGLAGAAAEHAAGLLGAVAAGHGQVSGPPLAVVGAVGIQAAEAREVVHGAAPPVRSWGGTPSCALSKDNRASRVCATVLSHEAMFRFVVLLETHFEFSRNVTSFTAS